MIHEERNAWIFGWIRAISAGQMRCRKVIQTRQVTKRTMHGHTNAMPWVSELVTRSALRRCHKHVTLTGQVIRPA